MKTINDILNFFEEFAPCATQMSFDNAGLIVGDKYTAVSRVLVALDITEDVVNEAESLGCELIISHHPVIFAPIKRLSPSSVPYMLAQKGISAVCMHTNLDLGEKFGVNICLADALKVKNPVLSELGECMFTGELENETDIHDFAKLAKKNLDCKGLRYTDIKDRVKKVAVSSGAGGSNVFDAALAGVDVIVTGEIKHHEIIAANSLGIDIIDAGHFKSEDIVILPLVNKLSKEFSEIIFTKSQSCDDMIKFI